MNSQKFLHCFLSLSLFDGYSLGPSHNPISQNLIRKRATFPDTFPSILQRRSAVIISHMHAFMQYQERIFRKTLRFSNAFIHWALIPKFWQLSFTRIYPIIFFILPWEGTFVKQMTNIFSLATLHLYLFARPIPSPIHYFLLNMALLLFLIWW